MKKQILSILLITVILFWNVPSLEATILTFNPNEGMPVAIPDNIPAGITRTYTVSGVPANSIVNNVTLTLQFSVTHTWAGDLNANLTSPDAETHTLFQRMGSTTGTGAGDSSDLQGPYVMADQGADTLWNAAVILVGGTVAPGTYRTTGAGSPTATSINTTFGYPGLPFADKLLGQKQQKKTIEVTPQVTNGTWTFNISDNAAGDTGTLSMAQLAIDFVSPVAANASIEGRLVTSSGNGIRNAFVLVTNTLTSETKSVRSSSFGYFKVEDLPVGNTYVIQVVSKQFQFPIQTIQLDDNVTDLIIQANE